MTHRDPARRLHQLLPAGGFGRLPLPGGLREIHRHTQGLWHHRRRDCRDGGL